MYYALPSVYWDGHIFFQTINSTVVCLNDRYFPNSLARQLRILRSVRHI